MPRPFEHPADRRSRARFARWAAEALDELPDFFGQRLSNVGIQVEDEPGPQHLAELEEHPGELLGLFVGIPRTEYGRDLSQQSPDMIFIFRGPIERISSSPARQREIVHDTVRHEVAHHFGISDDRLDELGLG